MNYKKRLQAQILVITLVVLMILSIIIVGIVSIASKDTEQTVSNKEYDAIRNQVELNLDKMIHDLATTDLGADRLSDCDEITEIIPAQQYICRYTQNTAVGSVRSEISVKDDAQVDKYQIEKDSSLNLSLIKENPVTGNLFYKNSILLEWNEQVAMDFALIYFVDDNLNNLYEQGEDIRVVKDVYDLAGVYDSLVSDDPYNDINGIHDFVYSDTGIDAEDLATKTRILIGDILQMQDAKNKPLYLRITPRMKSTGYAQVTISVSPDGANFPLQIREYTGDGYVENDKETSIVKIRTQIPLTPQTDSIFDYALLTEDQVETH